MARPRRRTLLVASALLVTTALLSLTRLARPPPARPVKPVLSARFAASARAHHAKADAARSNAAAWRAAGSHSDAADSVDDARWGAGNQAFLAWRSPLAERTSAGELSGDAFVQRMARPLDARHAAAPPGDWKEHVADVEALPAVRGCALQGSSAGGGPRALLYHRVGKAGSETLKAWLRQHAEAGGFVLVDVGSAEHLSLAGERDLMAQLVQGSGATGLFPQPGRAGALPRSAVVLHAFYANASRYNLPAPAPLTLLRDPITRYASQHAFWRGPAVLGAAFPSTHAPSLAACAADAALFGCPPANYATRYLCGHGPPCTDPPDEASLQQALAHLGHAFAFVGITEDLPQSLWLLRRRLPGWFPRRNGEADRGAASASFDPTERLNSAGIEAAAATARALTPEVVTALRTVNALDWRLYVAARALLERHVAACEAE